MGKKHNSDKNLPVSLYISSMKIVPKSSLSIFNQCTEYSWSVKEVSFPCSKFCDYWLQLFTLFWVFISALVRETRCKRSWSWSERKHKHYDFQKHKRMSKRNLYLKTFQFEDFFRGGRGMRGRR